MIAVILAGGKGTRLGLTHIPKPMVKIAGRPILEHQIQILRDYGITKIYFLCGHLWEKIEEYFKNGAWWGVEIEYIIENKPLGTAGSLRQLEGTVNGRFLLIYGDIMFNMDIARLMTFDRPDSIATIVAHPNDHPYDSDLLETNDKNQVIAFHSKPLDENKFYKNMVNSGIYCLSPDIFSCIPQDRPADLGKDILPTILDKKVYAYISPEYIKDIGTPDRLILAENDYLSGKINRLNLKNKRKAIFLDRDGVINKLVDNLSNIDDFELLPGAAEAIKRINKSEYLTIVVTNQPMIAKGFLTVEGLYNIHKKMDTLLGNERAFLNAVYYCPHHPDKGFAGEIPELKIRCKCRKPEPGLFYQAQKDFNIDLNNSWVIGDAARDITAGKAAKCRGILFRSHDRLNEIIDWILE